MRRNWPATALVVGAGRAGTSFARALAGAGVRTTLHGRTKAPRIKGIQGSSGSLPPALPFDLVVVATPDGAVRGIAASLPAARKPRRATVVHLAGALELDVLQAARDKGFRTGSLHPLQSIATSRTPLAGCPTGVDADGAATRRDLLALARRLRLVPLEPRHSRAAYHAAACVAGNYAQVLVEASLRLFEQAGLRREDALVAVRRLAESGLSNALERGPAAGLTGPIARGDAETVARHLAVIDDADVLALYRAAGRLAVHLAESRGTDVAAIDALLRPGATRRAD